MIKEKFFCNMVYYIYDDRIEHRNIGYFCHPNATFKLNEFGASAIYHTWRLNL